MKRCLTLLAGLALVSYLGGPAYAQSKHGVGGPGSSHRASGNKPSDAGKGSTTGHSATDLLSKNSKLNDALSDALTRKGLIPTGTTLQQMCANFRNLGQCVAAIHVSHNRHIPFGCLAWDVTGKQPGAPVDTSKCTAPTGGAMSLGKAIQKLDPSANAKAEARKAGQEADSEIKQASSS
ncbi:MAG TPA: hypothetical protein VKE24_08255 [Candidatus Acidoferrales bacterium]|nr:hypothetical protein [Candidatus Acidoferrales bacterium]